jgi:hypothetical protein
VRRLVGEILNGGHPEVIDELYTPELAPAARRWIAPFRASFPDVRMEIVELIAEGDKVVGASPAPLTTWGNGSAWPERQPEPEQRVDGCGARATTCSGVEINLC